MTRPDNFDYQAYLASREWALLKERVRERSRGRCERCITGKYEETHHVTYARIGHEDLGDLLAVCRNCHAFLSAKSDFDPADTCAFRELQDNEPFRRIQPLNMMAIVCPVCEGTQCSLTNDLKHSDVVLEDNVRAVSFRCSDGHEFFLMFQTDRGQTFGLYGHVRRGKQAP